MQALCIKSEDPKVVEEIESLLIGLRGVFCRLRKDKICMRLIAIMEEHPEVACRPFNEDDDGFHLHRFLDACNFRAFDPPVSLADKILRIVDMMLELNPEAIRQPNEDGFLPIHVVMNELSRQNNTVLSVIHTLLQAYPESLILRPTRESWHPKGLSPLELCFARYFPPFLRDRVMSYLVSPIATQSATAGASSVEHQNAPQQPLVFTCFHLAQGYPDPLPLEMAEQIGTLLAAQPQLIRFDCDVRNWEQPSFWRLLECLTPLTTLEEIGCLALPVQLISADFQPALDRIQRFFKTQVGAGRLRRIRWMVPYGSTGARSEDEDDSSEDSALLQAIYEGLLGEQVSAEDAFENKPNASHQVALCPHESSVLEDIEFENFVIMGIDVLCKQLVSARMPRKVHLVETVMGMNITNIQATATDCSNCRIQDLQMTRCPIATNCLLPLLQTVVHMHSLQRLVLELCNYRPGNEGPSLDMIDLTPSIAAMVEQLPHLVELKIDGGDIRVDDMEPISRALCANTSLREYNVPASLSTDAKAEHLVKALRDHNTTLQNVNAPRPINFRVGADFHLSCRIISQTAYWTLLNRRGRNGIRKDSASKTQLIQLLVQATKEKTTGEMVVVVEDSLPSKGMAFDRIMAEHRLEICNMQYGLMREVPNLWCYGYVLNNAL